MYVKIVLVSLLLVFLQHFLKIMYMMGYHVTVYNHTPGPCRVIPGVEHGSEDIETLSNGLAFITSGVGSQVQSEFMQKYYEEHNVKGRILLFDFNSPEKEPVVLDFDEGFDQSNFMPHGLSVYEDLESGRTLLFVVNHASGMDRIEKFEYHQEFQSLEHLHSYMHEAINLANDVAATGENSFYFTNSAYFRDHFRFMVENLLLLPFGNVVYFDGVDYTVVADGFVLTNGVSLSSDKQTVYVAASIFGMLNIFQRESNNSLTLVQEFPLYSMPDNIIVDKESGNLIIAADPVCHMTMEHLSNPDMPAASKVFIINMTNSSYADSITEIYSNDGESGDIWAASVGNKYKNKLLIGTVQHHLMYCDINL